MSNLNLQAIYLTHYGKSDRVKDHLNELESRLLEVTELIGDRLKEGKTEDEMVTDVENMFRAILLKAGVDKQLMKSYELADPFWMNVPGLVRYWEKFRM